ncbi:MAG: DUF1064 domain-containing protein [Pseudomonadota bacterium]|nr:DUF1064 domain-containing protein [Pseudomonadota bacterium]
MSKYRNKPVVVDNIRFASMREAAHYEKLRLLQKAGAISDLRLQVRYELLPRQDGEQGVAYVADFVYLDSRGVERVQDVKGVRNPVYVIKRKMMLFFHKIRIEEV